MAARKPSFRFIAWGDTGIRARVDADLWPELSRYRWNAFITKTAGKIYFRRTAADGRTTILLHREIMRLRGIAPPAPSSPNERLLVDHWDGNELDCRSANLRWATYRENNLNRRARRRRSRARRNR